MITLALATWRTKYSLEPVGIGVIALRKRGGVGDREFRTCIGVDR
jgi:hypothetical protein